MLQKVGFDTAENKPLKGDFWAEIWGSDILRMTCILCISASAFKLESSHYDQRRYSRERTVPRLEFADLLIILNGHGFSTAPGAPSLCVAYAFLPICKFRMRRRFFCDYTDRKVFVPRWRLRKPVCTCNWTHVVLSLQRPIQSMGVSTIRRCQFVHCFFPIEFQNECRIVVAAHHEFRPQPLQVSPLSTHSPSTVPPC